MYAALEAARDALADCATLAAAALLTPAAGSCKIGLEEGISPLDYPLIRLVPSRVTPGQPYGKRTIETLIYFGVPIANSQGLEAVYEGLSDFEAEILAVVKALGGRYLETVTDEDRLDTYKLMAVRCSLAA